MSVRILDGIRSLLVELDLQWIEVPHHSVLITPHAAQRLLDLNRNIREIKRNQLNKLIRDLLADRWSRNGATLVFDREGRLIDGQHRLTACIRTGVPFHAIIALDGDPEGIDATTPRTFADIVRGRHVSHAGPRSTAIRALYHRWIGIELVPVPGKKPTWSEAELVTFDREVIDGVRFEDAVSLIRTPGVQGRVNKSHLIALGYLLPEDLRAELRGLISTTFGNIETLHAGSAAFAWNRWATNPKVIRGGGGGEIIRQRWLAMLKAWNAYQTGRSIQLIRVAPNDAEPEIFGEDPKAFRSDAPHAQRRMASP